MKKSLINNYKLIKIILGILLIKISFILFISFISYLINSKIQNALGQIGTFLATLLLYHGIGISILLLPIVLFCLGLKIIFYIKNININKLILHCLFFIFWLPITLSLLFTNPILYGKWILKIKFLLIYFIGIIGLILILLTSQIIYIILIIHMTNMQFFLKKLNKFFFLN